VTAICTACHGDGIFIVSGGPGYYSRSFGNYLPSETEVPCESCDGFGEVEGCGLCQRCDEFAGGDCYCEAPTALERYQAATEASL
jgi:RecJ-like exonuclease